MVREVLSDDLLKAAIRCGSQRAVSQESKELDITLSGDGERTFLRVCAYLEWFSMKTEAEKAETSFRAAFDTARMAPATVEFFSIRNGARNAIEQLAKKLEIRESVKLEIDQATCIACVALVGSEQTVSTPDNVV